MPRKKSEKPAKAGRTQAGRWKKGISGNPNGMRTGSRHKATMAAQALLDGEAEALTRRAVELALEGDVTALRLCLERLLPPRKDRPVALDLPKIESAQDAVRAAGALIDAVSSGTITPGEAEGVSKILDAFRRALETAELEERIERLEERFNEHSP